MRRPCFSEVASLCWLGGCWPHVTVAYAAALRSRQDPGAPSSPGLVRRSFAVGTVLGDFAYIDGGEVSQSNGNQPSGNSGNAPSSQEPSTLSINLRESWTNTTVPIQAIQKSAPLLNSQAIWTDEPGKSFWIWGGAVTDGTPPPPGQAWKFSADGNGGGSWSLEPPSNPRIFNELARPVGCAYTQGGGVGYCMGGLLTSQSSTSVESDTDVAGLVSFGMSSSVWTNTSVPRTLVNAQAEYVPFGPNGLVLLLGGTAGDSPPTFSDFTNITFFDTITKQLFSQPATGTIPTGRQRFCSVAVAGPDNTTEIFLYGGLRADNTVSDEVFVLSLPGFVFAKADSPGATTARADHACVVVGGGKRQMLSIGGADASKGYPAALQDPDPWAQGLGVFDMTSLRWTDGYSSDAEAYDTPDVVKQFYKDGGLAKVQWASDEVKGLFRPAEPGLDGGSGNNSPGSTSDNNNNNHNNNNNSNNNNNNDNPGNDTNDPNGSGTTLGLSRQAILGLSISGSAALPILIGSIYYFCCRRRQQQRRRRRRTPSSGSISATTTTTVHHHSKRRRSSDATSSAASYDRDLPDVSSHQRLSLARPFDFDNNNKEGGEGGAAGAGAYLSVPQAHEPASLARRSLDQYSVHIKGNATPIIIDSAAMTAAARERDEERQQRQQQRQTQTQGAAAGLPQTRRVRFSALLRPPPCRPVAALQPQQALGGNPVTILSGLADRRGRPALQAIRTRAAASSEGELGGGGGDGGGIRDYQDRPAW